MMKKQLQNSCIAVLALMLSLNIQGNAQKFAWVKNFNTYYNNSSVTSRTTTDQDGNLYMISGFNADTLYMGSTSIAAKTGGTNGFIVKLTPGGALIWAKAIHSNSFASVQDIKTDHSGNVYISGLFNNRIDFAPGFVLHAQGNYDAFTAKLDAAGNFIWVKGIGGASFDDGEYMAVDPLNNVYILGRFQGTIDLNPANPGIDTFTAMGGTAYDRFLCKMDSNGNYLWGLHYQKGSNITEIGGMALDPSGNAYVVGSYFQTLNFPASSGMAALNAVQPYDMSLVKIAPDGKFIWAKSFGGTGDGDFGYDMVADENYNLYIVGNFNGTCNLDPNGSGPTFTPTPNPKYATLYYDAFVLKIDSGGNYIWAKTFGSSQHDDGIDIAVDKVGNVYATGSFQDTVNFVPGSSRPEDNLISKGGYDIFVVKYDQSGGYVWSASFGSKTTAGINQGEEHGTSIWSDQFGGIFVTGVFQNKVDFDPGPDSFMLDYAKGMNTFLLKLGCNDTTSSALNAEGCGSYTYYGTTYDSSGTYLRKFAGASGCDSTVTLTVAIHHIVQPVVTVNGFILGVQQPYSSYQWLLNGNAISGATSSTYTVTANGQYSVIVTNENGCIDTSSAYIVENYTGLEDIASLSKLISVYPNPAKDLIHINAPVAVNVTVNSLEGRMLSTVKNADHISVRNLANGIYFLRISDQKGTLIKVEKIIKR